jgi:trans-aconitate 2-methyltransferase
MTTARNASEFHSGKVFSGRTASTELFLATVLSLLPQSNSLKILDLGCGTGHLSFSLKRERPELEIVGVDISSCNVQIAIKRAATMNSPEGLSFATANYCNWSTAPFDVILAESVLHLIASDDQLLIEKLALDLSPGGFLIATMPHQSFENTLLFAQRRLWRMLPTFIDRVAIAVARIAYPQESPTIITERVRYLRLLPERLNNENFISQMKCAGLALIQDQEWPSASLIKPRHRLLVFRRLAG